MGAGGVKIEDRVLLAIDAAVKGDLELALSLICPAIEATARKTFKKSKISGTEYKQYLRNYSWLIEYFSGSGIDLANTKFPNAIVESDDKRVIVDPDFADIVYHIFRCSSAHGHKIPDGFQFIASGVEGMRHTFVDFAGSTVRFPESILWALVANVVFCSANNDIVTNTSQFLTWGQGANDWRKENYRFDVDVFWGAEEVVKRFFDARTAVKVELVMPPAP